MGNAKRGLLRCTTETAVDLRPGWCKLSSVRHQSDEETITHVHRSASCGIAKTAPCAGRGNQRGARASVDRRPEDRRVEASQVAGKGRNDAAAAGRIRPLTPSME